MADDGAGETKRTDAMNDAADKLRTGAETMRTTFQEHVVEPARRAGEAMRDSGRKMAENSSSLGLKVIDQAESNAREAFEALRAAARASDLTEVMRIQGNYLRDQGQRSMDHAREIGELIMQFGRDAVTPVKKDGEGNPGA